MRGLPSEKGGEAMREYVNGDCMDYLPKFSDNEFDLAIVDPPYGGGGQQMLTTPSTARLLDALVDSSPATSRTIRGGGALTAIGRVGRTGGTWATKYQTNGGIFDHDIRHWDIAPSREYFDQLFRVSKNQIIWGGNYFDLPPTRCFLVWRKTNIPTEGFTMCAVEYAWTSFNKNAMVFERHSSGTQQNPRIHPTQKPIELYQWMLSNFAEKGMRILDTHVGSGSSLIACERMGFEYVGFEINETYYRMSRERIERETAQGTLF